MINAASSDDHYIVLSSEKYSLKVLKASNFIPNKLFMATAPRSIAVRVNIYRLENASTLSLNSFLKTRYIYLCLCVNNSCIGGKGINRDKWFCNYLSNKTWCKFWLSLNGHLHSYDGDNRTSSYFSFNLPFLTMLIL